MRPEQDRPEMFDDRQRYPAESRTDQAPLNLTEDTLMKDRDDLERTVELREERLVPRKETVDAGEIEIRKEVEEVPGRLEVEAYREEVEIEHVPVGQAVKEKVEPWEEDGTLVVPVYEEQLVVVKRLVMKEKLLIRRVGGTEKRLFTDTLRREKLVVDDPNNTGLVHEQHPTDRQQDEDEESRDEHGGIIHNIVRRALS